MSNGGGLKRHCSPIITDIADRLSVHVYFSTRPLHYLYMKPDYLSPERLYSYSLYFLYTGNATVDCLKTVTMYIACVFHIESMLPVHPEMSLGAYFRYEIHTSVFAVIVTKQCFEFKKATDREFSQ